MFFWVFFLWNSAGGSGIHRPVGGREESGADYKAKVKLNLIVEKQLSLYIYKHNSRIQETLKKKKKNFFINTIEFSNLIGPGGVD